MHPQLQRWHDGFQAQAEEARALLTPLSEASYTAAGPGGGWSAAQCVGHLLQVGEPLLGHLTAALERARAEARMGRPPFRFGWMGRWMIAAVTPGSRAIPTPRLYRPLEVLPRAEALARFATLQAELAAFVAGAEGVALDRVRAPSPAMPLLRLNAAAWLETTLCHGQRHLDQARRAVAFNA